MAVELERDSPTLESTSFKVEFPRWQSRCLETTRQRLKRGQAELKSLEQKFESDWKAKMKPEDNLNKFLETASSTLAVNEVDSDRRRLEERNEELAVLCAAMDKSKSTLVEMKARLNKCLTDRETCDDLILSVRSVLEKQSDAVRLKKDEAKQLAALFMEPLKQLFDRLQIQIHQHENGTIVVYFNGLSKLDNHKSCSCTLKFTGSQLTIQKVNPSISNSVQLRFENEWIERRSLVRFLLTLRRQLQIMGGII